MADEEAPRHDFRMPLLGVGAWCGGIASYQAGDGRGWVVGLVVVVLAAASWRWRGRFGSGQRRLAVGMLLLAGAVAASVLLRHHQVASSPLSTWAADGASADVVATVAGDPHTVSGQWGDLVVVRLRAQRVTARGVTVDLGGSIVVMGDPAWVGVQLGEQVLAEGRLAPPDDPDTAALLTGARPPTRIRGPDAWWRAAAAVRRSIRDSVAHRPAAQAGLVPALVDGDDAGLPPEVEADFRTTGLTHLTAVSGTNLTLVVGALLLLARAIGVRRRWLMLVGLAGIAGFVLLARTEPSVVRAAAMGTVGLFAFGPDGRRRGLRALGVAVAAVLLIEPPLSVSPGFALSVLATGGIVLLGPPLTDALRRWLPAGLAEAIAVPTAAQLACTPVIAALSGEVSIVAVAANLLAEPVVGPATVLGLLGGLVGLVSPWAGRLCGTLAGWCVAWIIAVAQHGAAVPGAAFGWGTSGLAVTLLVLLCIGVAIALPAVLRRRALGAALAVLLVAVLLGLPARIWSSVPLGWPPEGWVLVACDVGQGDGLVLNTGDGTGVVVDAGPDPDVMDRCLDRLHIRTIPLVVLTHFHADHVDGLAGVLRGRRVAAIETTAVLDPPQGVTEVQEAADRAGIPLRIAPYPTTREYGDLRLQVVAPDIPQPVPGAGDGSSANDASVVLLVEAHGLRILMTGDVEPPSQARLAATLGTLDVDVLKVPHHGSAHQDMSWLCSLHAEQALISVGAGNDYGHPSQLTMNGLDGCGTTVHRTDEEGSLAVLGDGSVVSG